LASESLYGLTCKLT